MNMTDMMLNYLAAPPVPPAPATGKTEPRPDTADKSNFQQMLKDKQQADQSGSTQTDGQQQVQDRPNPEADGAPVHKQDGRDEQAALALYQQMAAAQQAVIIVPAEEQAPAMETQAQPLIAAVQTVPVQDQQQAPVLADAGQQPQTAQPQTVDTSAQTPAQPVQAHTAPQETQAVTHEGVQAQRQTGQAEKTARQQPAMRGQDETQVTEAAEPSVRQPLFRDVEAAPVKVGDAPVLDGEAEDLDVQLAKQVDDTLAKGQSRVEIKLTPENLGAITVTMTRSEDGSLHVALAATSERATSLLEKHASGLQGLLMGSTQSDVRVEVQHPQEGQQSGGQPQEREGQSGGQHPQQDDRRQQRHGQDFLQQLRLGLVDQEAI